MIKKQLPYDFISFPKTYQYPYDISELPKHNTIQGLSGRIDYEVKPYTDLAMDFRKINKNYYQISGSSIRGRVRSNLEILSASYPTFINDVELSYRTIQDKKNYLDKLKGYGDGNIESNIHVGFLRKEGKKFVIYPAEMIGRKNFKSIKEDELWDKILDEKVKLLFKVDGKNEKNKKEIIKIRKKINELTETINRIKKEQSDSKDKENYKKIAEQRDKVFKREANFTRWFNFKNNDSNENAIEKNIKKIESELEQINTYELDVKFFHKAYLERLKCKAKLYLEYLKLSKYCKNPNFEPYQSEVLYRIAGNGSIEMKDIKLKQNEDGFQKGYLYNSTDASSKRGHYLIGACCETNPIEISEDIIFSYNNQLKRFEVSPRKGSSINKKDYKEKIKPFYDIFDNFDNLKPQKTKKSKEALEEVWEGAIVFYRYGDKEKNEKLQISRTPYMRIAYEKQIKDIIRGDAKLKTDENNIRVDYSRSLFGFVNNDFWNEYDSDVLDKIKSYKSRLRFSGLNIETKTENIKIEDFVLLSPSPSACGMYINQTEYSSKLKTYEDKDVQLNGYKYYKILEEVVFANSSKSNDEVNKCRSKKQVIKKENIRNMNGSIYFNNLSKLELGLLILSLDINQINRHGWVDLSKNIEPFYDMIGGAKPYGYGCVQFKINDIIIDNLEPSLSDFNKIETWTKEPIKLNASDEIVDSCIGEYLVNDFVDDIIYPYIVSKQKVKSKNIINWEILPKEIEKYSNKNNSVGYSKEWILEKILSSKDKYKIINRESIESFLEMKNKNV